MDQTRQIAALLQEADEINSARISALANSNASLDVLEQAFETSYKRKAMHLSENGIICSPVKIGQLVWLLYTDEVRAFKVSSIDLKISSSGIDCSFSAELVSYDRICKIDLWDYEMGKIAFFTYEEAIAALQKGK